MLKNVIKAALVAATLGFGFVANGPAHALDSLKILVPANPGGGWDQTARALKAAMDGIAIIRKVTVDNRGGAGGTIGLAQFVNAARGDSSATMVGGMGMVSSIATNKAPVHLGQVTPLARLTGEPLVVVVPASSNIQTLQALLEQFRANPGAVSWGGGSAGGVDHILAAMIAQAVGVDPKKVNYIAYAGGGEAQTAVMGGHVAAGISGYGEFQSQIRSGRLRALAMSGAERIPGEDIPTLKELGMNAQLINWRAIFAAPDISEAQQKALLAALDKTVASSAWQETLKRNDWADMYLAGTEFKQFLDADVARITNLVADLGLVKQ